MGAFPTAEAATCLLLGWASASDLRTRTIPNACSVGGAVSMAAVSIFADADPVVLAWSVGLVAVFFGGAVVCRPRSLGAGDAKLAVLLAAAMGPLSVLALLLGLALALAWCLGRLGRERRRAAKAAGSSPRPIPCRRRRHNTRAGRIGPTDGPRAR